MDRTEHYNNLTNVPDKNNNRKEVYLFNSRVGGQDLSKSVGKFGKKSSIILENVQLEVCE